MIAKEPTDFTMFDLELEEGYRAYLKTEELEDKSVFRVVYFSSALAGAMEDISPENNYTTELANHLSELLNKEVNVLIGEIYTKSGVIGVIKLLSDVRENGLNISDYKDGTIV